MEKIQNFVASITGQEKVGFFDSATPSFTVQFDPDTVVLGSCTDRFQWPLQLLRSTPYSGSKCLMGG